MLYLNDGDCVERCTTLVEHADGSMELLHWTEKRLALAHSAPLVAVPMPFASAAWSSSREASGNAARSSVPIPQPNGGSSYT